ncbi:MAG TPA: ATP-binding protein [Treponema sp.]|nr:ATP-binding protein [Treponema sp.]HPC72444.1 ATP-binding protein [Treponema sp.]HRS05114.1 ATP-binding protein [Treponema sp.]
MFTRAYEPLDSKIQPNKVLILYGPRRVGKTTLLHQFLQHTAYRYKLDSGDNIRTQQILGSQDFSLITQYAEGYDLIAIDEAQNIPHIGMGLKILVDQIPGIRVIATGSSSFELAGQTGEPLTGRKRTITLFPLAQMELLSVWNRFELREKLPDFLIYGTYPEVLIAPSRQERIEVLTELTHSYLLKDILALDRVKNSRTLLDLLKLLAFQIGNEVSIHELANTLGIDAKTVKRYVDLLEQTFVIVRLGGFSRNLRQEISNKAKYYFLDNGIRNALIANFNTLDLRNDQGALWENFVLMERLKFRTYNGVHGGMYFWRTYQQQEIDLIEERDGTLYAYECKWSEKHKNRVPPAWAQAYPDTSFKVINPENYQDFVLP